LAGRSVSMGGRDMHTGLWWGSLQGGALDDLGEYGRIILKRIK
jgi:hypothetical protein